MSEVRDQPGSQLVAYIGVLLAVASLIANAFMFNRVEKAQQAQEKALEEVKDLRINLRDFESTNYLRHQNDAGKLWLSQNNTDDLVLFIILSMSPDERKRVMALIERRVEVEQTQPNRVPGSAMRFADKFDRMRLRFKEVYGEDPDKAP